MKFITVGKDGHKLIWKKFGYNCQLLQLLSQNVVSATAGKYVIAKVLATCLLHSQKMSASPSSDWCATSDGSTQKRDLRWDSHEPSETSYVPAHIFELNIILRLINSWAASIGLSTPRHLQGRTYAGVSEGTLSKEKRVERISKIKRVFPQHNTVCYTEGIYSFWRLIGSKKGSPPFLLFFFVDCLWRT